MQRFYKEVTTGPAVTGGFVILLDGRPVRTPEKALMAAPTAALVQLVAAEWAAQGESISPDTMPLTQLLTTEIDRAALRAEIAESALHYVNSDLLCYRTAEPDTLAAEQARLWDPWTSWFASRFGHALTTTVTLIRIDQPQAALAAAQAAVAGMDTQAFTVFQTATAITGSAILGLAMASGAITPEETFACALCEELWYERVHDLERHGLDPIEEKRRAFMRRDLAAAATYLAATRV